MFIGFTGAAFNKDATVEVQAGSKVQLGAYELTVGNMETGQNENYSWGVLPVEVSSGGRVIGTLRPERRFYPASQQPTSEVSIRRRLNEDLYLNFAGSATDNKRFVLQGYVFPLVSWIWLGYWVTLFGTIICLVPAKVQRQFLRTQVVGVTPAHAPVEK
jgi:cytochrome c-type biogenesis protein CcmF